MISRSFTLKEYSGIATTFLFINANTNAQVIYTDIDPDIELQFNGETAGVDMDNNGTIDFAFLKSSATFTTFSGSSDITLYRQAIWVGPYGTPLNVVAGSYTQQSEAGDVYYNPYALNQGSMIDNNLSFHNNGFQIMESKIVETDGGFHGAHGNWYLDLENRYLGIKFIDSDDCFHYGWIRCSVTDTSKRIIIKDYAYEVACEHAIVAGDTISYVGITEGQSNLDVNLYSFGCNINIKVNEKLNNAIIQVYNLEGTEIYSEKLQNQFTEIKLYVPKGIYLVEIIANEGRFIKRVYLN